MEFCQSIKNRRSYYGISPKVEVSDEKIKEIINTAIKHTPSAFNSQVQRVCLLLNENHKKIWDITAEILKKIVPADSFGETQEKLNSFKAGYGTVLFFNDSSVTKSLQEQFPLYKDKFPIFAHHANGMLQFAVWNMLEMEGMGASLQHYNPLIDEEVRATFDINENWELEAQMPFGKPTQEPDEKVFMDLSERVKFII